MDRIKSRIGCGQGLSRYVWRRGGGREVERGREGERERENGTWKLKPDSGPFFRLIINIKSVYNFIQQRSEAVEEKWGGGG